MLPALVPILILLPSDNRNNVACGATTLGASGRRSPREPSASPTHNFAHSEATMETKDAMALCMVRLLIGTAGCSRPSVLLPVQFFNGRAGR